MRSSSNRAFMEDSRVKARRREAMERIGPAPRLPRHASCSCSWSLSPWPSNDGFFEQLVNAAKLDEGPWEMYTLDTTIDLNISTTSRRSPTGPSRRCACPLTSSSIVNRFHPGAAR
uniref:Uncharacterized protein n=1 Tax=Oryza nivara TaxID=4536 RepID=A0A0E0J3J2_ORYNI